METAHAALHLDADAALRHIAEGTAAATGADFFRALVEHLASALGTYGAWVTEYLPESRRLRALAFHLGGRFVEHYEHAIDNTPCQAVVEGRRLLHIPDRILELYPDEPDLRAFSAVSYLGVPLIDRCGDPAQACGADTNATAGRGPACDDGGVVMGHLAVLDRKPIPPDPRLLAVFRIFADRAAAEMQRLAAEARLRERERKLGRLIDSAMDAIVDLDHECRIALANAAAERIFRCPVGRLVGRPIADLMTPAGHRKLLDLSDQLKATGGGWGATWVPGTLEARRCDDGQPFAAEATLSRYELGGRPCHTLILRDVGERLEAERTIRTLSAEAEYLRDELRQAQGACGRLVGQSPAIRQVLRDVEQVAATDATVLILGETGTGKELVAHAIHAASRRRYRPLVRVNCAAIPAALMESEFFGHEKGAFTGATQKREGRFALADGGTLFLDEVGELPVDLQGKLLRALQEGEFEPVGSSRTVKVDVRVIAATNRDLGEAIRAGTFREDLYYRLNVFPIRVPPLRERGDDIGLLARALADRAAARIGRGKVTVTDACVRRLRAYGWPGNVRELENVIERAVITAVDGRLNLDRALPETAACDGPAPAPASSSGGATGAGASPIRTIPELEALERETILAALRQCDGRIAGDQGAARLLDIHPSTLRSRIKALDLQRPGPA